MSIFTDLLNLPKLQNTIKDKDHLIAQQDEEIKRLREQLNKKQQHIDKTNAYYKGILRKNKIKA